MTYKELKPIVTNLIKRAAELKKRKIVHLILKEFEQKPDIKVIRGFRGVGKTTALLQIMHEWGEKCFYFSADWPQVRKSTVYDFTVDALRDGNRFIFIDEIHTYPEWESEVKAIVDQFPDTKLFVSGSAPVVFVGDRRQSLYDLEPLDFSEFLYLKYEKRISSPSNESWMDEDKSISTISEYFPQVEGWFREYYQVGGFPVSIDYPFEKTLEAIFTAIKMSLEKDAASFLKISAPKILAMEKFLYFLATSKPGEMSITSLCKNLTLSKDSVYEILSALEKMKIIRVLKPYGSGSKLIRGEPKILFTHPNLRVSICKKLGMEPEIGSIREELALFGFERRGYNCYTVKGLKKNPDYILKMEDETLVVEIGGKSKTRKQLADFENGILVRDMQLMSLVL